MCLDAADLHSDIGAETHSCAKWWHTHILYNDAQYCTPVQPDRKPTFARPSGTTTSATAPAAKRNTITDSSTASDRC